MISKQFKRPAEAGLGVGDDRREPVALGAALGMLDLVGALQRAVDPPAQLRPGIGRVERLVGIHGAGGVGVGRDLPAGEIDRLEPGADHLHRLVAGDARRARGPVPRCFSSSHSRLAPRRARLCSIGTEPRSRTTSSAHRAARCRRSGRAGRGRHWSKLVMHVPPAESVDCRQQCNTRSRSQAHRQKGSRCHKLTCDFCAKLTDACDMSDASSSSAGACAACAASSAVNQTAWPPSSAISPCYLNHLERNQRPVTAGAAAEAGRALRRRRPRASPPSGGARTGPEALAEIFADPMFADLGIPRYELVELADNAPSVADAIARLYAALKEAGRNPSLAQRRRCARAGHARKLGARLYPGAAQPFPVSGGGGRDAGRRARAIRCRWPSRCGGG